jgi:DNA-binding YbaB/EbfC family protein
MGMGNLAKMAQQMQADMARAQQELDELRVEGSAGGGVVTAVVTGKLDIISITVDPEVVDPDDLDDLQDLVVAAVADAQTNAKAAAEEKMNRIASGMNLPPGLGLPGM